MHNSSTSSSGPSNPKAGSGKLPRNRRMGKKETLERVDKKLHENDDRMVDLNRRADALIAKLVTSSKK